VAKAHLLVDFDAVVELKRRRLGGREYLHVALGELDLAGGESSLTVPSVGAKRRR